MSHLFRTATLLALPLAIIGCAPLNPSLKIDDAPVGGAASAESGINSNTATILGSSLLITGPVDPNQANNRIRLSNPGSPADLGVLPPGRYFGNMQWSYQRMFSGTPETINASSVDFQVLEPDGCFTFNFGAPPPGAGAWTPSTQGWSASQFFVGDTDVLASQTAIPGLSPLNNQLDLLIHPNALRASSTVPLWRTDVQSPSLEKNAAWQTATGIQYWISASRYTNLNLQVQSILRVRKADGTIALFAEGMQGNRVFYPINTWSPVVSPIALPAGSTVVGAIIRIFGLLPLPTGPDINIKLGSICPKP